jgi:hypothetical protein
MIHRIPLRLRLLRLSRLAANWADLKNDAEYSAAIQKLDRAKSVHR